MIDSFIQGLSGLSIGTVYLFGQGLPNVIMLLIAAVLLYLAIAKEVEPLLLLPIGFGCLLVNIPLSDMMDKGGLLRFLYDIGITTEIFPLLIFVGIGAMTDFTPLLENPKILLIRRSRAIRYFHDPSTRPGAWIQSVGSGMHRHHRRLRWPYCHLRYIAIRAAAFGSGLGGRVWIHVSGPDNPAAYYARIDQ